MFFCRALHDSTSLWHVSPMYYCSNHSPTVYDPTNLGAMSAGHQYNLYLWPTRAWWSNDPNDSGVYCATTPAFGINHTLLTHGPTVAMAPTGLAVYEITSAHPAYNTFQNSQNPNFVSCPNKVDISVLSCTSSSAHPAESHNDLQLILRLTLIEQDPNEGRAIECPIDRRHYQAAAPFNYSLRTHPDLKSYYVK